MTDLFIRLAFTKDGIAIYRVQSSSRSRKRHFPAIDTTTTEADCTCEHFTMTLAPEAERRGITITIDHPRYRCRHINTITRDCLRNGDIDRQALQKD